MAKKSPAPKTAERAQLGVRIPVGTFKRLGHYVVDHGRSQAEVVAEALDEYLKKRGA